MRQSPCLYAFLWAYLSTSISACELWTCLPVCLPAWQSACLPASIGRPSVQFAWSLAGCACAYHRARLSVFYLLWCSPKECWFQEQLQGKVNTTGCLWCRESYSSTASKHSQPHIALKAFGTQRDRKADRRRETGQTGTQRQIDMANRDSTWKCGLSMQNPSPDHTMCQNNICL